jgi:hypothetical protein
MEPGDEGIEYAIHGNITLGKSGMAAKAAAQQQPGRRAVTKEMTHGALSP